MAVNKKNIMTRYFFVVLVMGLIGVAIIVKGTVIMFAERQYWQECRRPLCEGERHRQAQPGQYSFIRRQTDGKFLTGVPHLHGLQSRRSEERHHAYEPPG